MKQYNNVFNLTKDMFEKTEMIEKHKYPLVKNIKKVTCTSIQGLLVNLELAINLISKTQYQEDINKFKGNLV